METTKKEKSKEHVPTPGLYGWITHTELISDDPALTKAWCADVLKWNFHQAIPTPTDDYHLYNYSDQGGGGIRKTGPEELPGCIPFVHVENIDESYVKAIDKGATAIMEPDIIMANVQIAIVKAPGGVVIGLSGPGE
jgi:predicted enzyme related to lactoylglutathione lyase